LFRPCQPTFALSRRTHGPGGGPPTPGGMASSLAGFMRTFLSVVLYNPMTASCYDRVHDIVAELGKYDELVLPGSGDKAIGDDMPVLKSQFDDYVWYRWGWKKSVASNRSCGISVLVINKINSGLRCTWSPPAHLRGRAAAIRFRSKAFDVTLLVGWLPPASDPPLGQDPPESCEADVRLVRQGLERGTCDSCSPAANSIRAGSFALSPLAGPWWL